MRGQSFTGDAAVDHVTVECVIPGPSPPPAPSPPPPMHDKAPWTPEPRLQVLGRATDELLHDFEQRCMRVCKNAKSSCAGFSFEASCSDPQFASENCCIMQSSDTSFFTFADNTRTFFVKNAAAGPNALHMDDDDLRLESLLGDNDSDAPDSEEEELEEDESEESQIDVEEEAPSPPSSIAPSMPPKIDLHSALAGLLAVPVGVLVAVLLAAFIAGALIMLLVLHLVLRRTKKGGETKTAVSATI